MLKLKADQKRVFDKVISTIMQLPVEYDNIPKYKPLADHVLKVLRADLKDVVLFIIDEVSMISNLTLLYIHLRLEKIKLLLSSLEYFIEENSHFISMCSKDSSWIEADDKQVIKKQWDNLSRYAESASHIDNINSVNIEIDTSVEVIQLFALSLNATNCFAGNLYKLFKKYFLDVDDILTETRAVASTAICLISYRCSPVHKLDTMAEGRIEYFLVR
ncbi:hypothetical protein ALC56_14957 [Trachymyrmex septentrionalis]|uniref:Uncharacterized protein n=1 Tax=Trachymyrmex septentrionalis TaxID=34720 RepID=A0A151JT10_9HYME|nr:hypothetical protein ALC56_14957 [Trachymyrmex septentrionalis]